VQPRSCSTDQAGLKQVELGAPVHLTLDELELGDLAFSLSVGPRRRDCGVDGGPVPGDAVGEGRDEALRMLVPAMGRGLRVPFCGSSYGKR
jgi:hypothetical protein